jgi:hypothetical protein
MGEIAEPVGEPRGVIRVRPERDASQELVNAGR